MHLMANQTSFRISIRKMCDSHNQGDDPGWELLGLLWTWRESNVSTVARSLQKDLQDIASYIYLIIESSGTFMLLGLEKNAKKSI
jgi:hypothetical protein